MSLNVVFALHELIKIRATMLYYFNEESKCRLCTYYIILKYAIQCFIIQ